MKRLSDHNAEAKAKREIGLETAILCDECGSQLRTAPRPPDGDLREIVAAKIAGSMTLHCTNVACKSNRKPVEAFYPIPPLPEPTSPRSVVTFVCRCERPEPRAFIVTAEMPIRFEVGRDAAQALTGPGSRTILANGMPLGDVDTDWRTGPEYLNALANVVNAGVRTVVMADLFSVERALRDLMWLPTRMESDYDTGKKGWD